MLGVWCSPRAGRMQRWDSDDLEMSGVSATTSFRSHSWILSDVNFLRVQKHVQTAMDGQASPPLAWSENLKLQRQFRISHRTVVHALSS